MYSRLRVHPEIEGAWILYRDNAPCCCPSVKQFLTDKNMTVLSQAPYSPDMSPCDCFLFPRVKQIVKGTHFESITDIPNSLTMVIRELPIDAFQKCYENWKRHRNEYVVWKRSIYFLQPVSLFNYCQISHLIIHFNIRCEILKKFWKKLEGVLRKCKVCDFKALFRFRYDKLSNNHFCLSVFSASHKNRICTDMLRWLPVKWKSRWLHSILQANLSAWYLCRSWHVPM